MLYFEMMKFVPIISFIIFFSYVCPIHSDIYKYVDENGVTLFTNISRGSDYKKVLSDGHGKGNVNQKRYSQIISRKARKYNIESSLIGAIITAESNWKPYAISVKGAKGLMQLMPSTISDMKVKDPFDPEDNIEGGTKYLRHLLDRFSGDLELALAAYNAGPGTVKKHRGIPPIRETRRYVKKVLSVHRGVSDSAESIGIYKVTYDDGTVLYTNTPSRYQRLNPSRF